MHPPLHPGLHPHTGRRLRAAVVGLLVSVAWGGAQAASPQDDQAYFQHASACVAAIKQDVVGLAARHEPGQAALRSEILRLTEQSFAFVGTAYKMGLRNPQAKQLLDDAEQRHAQRPAAEQRQLSASCQTEGARLVAEANVLERMVLRNRATARVNKLLAPDAAPPATSAPAASR